MQVTFESIDNENNKVFYRSEGRIENSLIIFKDKSAINTDIILDISDDKLLFKRVGNISMYLPLDLEKITHGTYNNNMGLEFKFDVKTTVLNITTSKINIEYQLFIETDLINEHKIWILFH